MKNGFLRRVLIALIISIHLVASSISAQVDFSGLDTFWEIVSILEKDDNPPAELWEKLFTNPGYTALTKSEFRREFFIKRFELAFMPSRKSERDKHLKSAEGWTVSYLKHYIRVGEMRKPIMSFRHRLEKESLIARAVDIAADWLPLSSIESHPPVSFVVFGPDARGYTPVVIDILYGMDKGNNLINLLAHEFHHYYRNRILAFDRDKVPKVDMDIIWVFDQLQAEGTASIVTYRHLLGKDNLTEELPESFRNFFRKSPEIIRTLDDLLSRMAERPEEKIKLGKELRKTIPRSGHPTGFFMALTILNTLGADALIKETGNPFNFVYLYQQSAARMKGEAPLFSEKSIEFLKNLENRMSRRSENL